MKIRKSIINDYKMCPLHCQAVWFKRIKQEPVDIMKVGTKFHKTVPEFYKVVDWDKLTSLSLQDARKYFVECWPAPQTPDEIVLATNFVDHQMFRYLTVRDFGKEYFYPLELEYKVETNNFQGTIDAIFKYNQTYNCVHEWKTGSSFNIRSLRGELAFYCTIANATKYQGTLHYISCFGVYVNKFLIEKLHAQSTNAMKRWLQKLIESQKTGVWPRVVGGWCINCPIHYNCLMEKVPDELMVSDVYGPEGNKETVENTPC